jgi:uncharacterized membrane protein YqjE
VLIISDPEYRVPLFLLTIIGVFINSIWLTWTLSKRKLQGQISIKKNAPKTFYTKLMVLTLFVIFSFTTTYDTNYLKYLNVSFLVLAFTFEEVNNYVKRKLKYDLLIIDDSKLIVNGLFLIRRDLKDLIQIKSFDLGDYLVLTFKNSRQVIIERSHYKKEELWDFISKMTSLSNEKVVMTPGVMEKF